MGLREILETIALPTGLEALLLGKEVVTHDGCSLGRVKKVEVDPAQGKLQMWIAGIPGKVGEFHISDIQSLSRKTIVLRDGVCPAR